MSDVEQIHQLARELAAKAEAGGAAELALALDKITQAARLSSDLEKARAETAKLRADEQKARHDLEHAVKLERQEGRQRYITLITPLASTLVLALTLLVQTYQFVTTERNKQMAQEDAQWAEAVKTVSQSGKLSPATVALNPFLKSQRYADVARQTAVQLLVNTHDQLLFADLFRAAFVPIDWRNLDAVLQLNRSLGPRAGVLYEKINTLPDKNKYRTLLSAEEVQDYDYLTGALRDIGKAVAPLLRETRPAGRTLELQSTSFRECDWSGASLSGADLANADIRFCDLKGADLSGVTSFSGLWMPATEWWTAKKIEPKLLEYLSEQSPYDPSMEYGPKFERVPRQRYEQSIARLRAGT